jgi:hypothetical protein
MFRGQKSSWASIQLIVPPVCPYFLFFWMQKSYIFDCILGIFREEWILLSVCCKCQLILMLLLFNRKMNAMFSSCLLCTTFICSFLLNLIILSQSFTLSSNSCNLSILISVFARSTILWAWRNWTKETISYPGCIFLLFWSLDNLSLLLLILV